MERRTLLKILGAAGLFSARAQAADAKSKRLGLLSSEHNSISTEIAALLDALKALGWEEGSTLTLDVGYSGGTPAGGAAAASDLLKAAPDVLLADTTTNLQALKTATTTIPIVFVRVSDPVAQGFVQNMARPGGNITGFSFFEFPVIGKGLSLLKQIAPQVRHVALLANPDVAPQSNLYLKTLQTLAPSLGMSASAAWVHGDPEIADAIAALAREPNGGLVVLSTGWTAVHHRPIIAAANKALVPSIYFTRLFAAEGGLLAYCIDEIEQFRQAAGYIDRIFKGTKPGDLPVQEPTIFNLVINLKTAHSLGIVVSRDMQIIANELIE
jgi:putative ABC transport system substrate-binding protein